MYEKPSLAGDANFKLHAPFQPAGDQPQAIADLTRGLEQGLKNKFYWALRGPAKHSPWRILFKI